MSGETKHEPGDTVYLLDGREVEYRGSAGAAGHVVAQLYDTEYGTETGTPYVCESVYTEPPTERLREDVAELEKRVQELQQEQFGLQHDIRENERLTKERLKKLSRYKGLERIEEFIEGRMTHAVITSQYGIGVEVVPWGEAVADGEKHCRDLRLICLFGKSNGDLAWMRNRYYDGSGGWDGCEPFCSEEDAIARARELLAEGFASAPNAYSLGCLIASARKLGVEVPADAAAAHEANLRESAEQAVEKAQMQLQAAELKLAEIAARCES